MIEIRNIKKSYGKKDVLRDINLTIHDGEIICLLGKNGAGKSTLLNIITKLCNATSGNIICNNVNFKANEINYKKQIAYVPDGFKDFDFFTGNEYLNFLLNIYNLPIEKSLIDHYVCLFQLTSDINNKILTYSSGTKKKISIIGALLVNPPIFIFDEPEQGLDIYIRKVLIDELRKLSKNNTSILISTHDTTIMENLCNKVALLVNGKISAVDSANNLKKNYGKDNMGDVFWEVNKNAN